MKPVPDAVRDHLHIDDGVGLIVHTVAKGSPAAKAKLQPHDILLKFDEQILIISEQLITLVRNRDSGSKATLLVVRKGERRKLKVTLGDAPENMLGLTPVSANELNKLFGNAQIFGANVGQSKREPLKQLDIDIEALESLFQAKKKPSSKGSTSQKKETKEMLGLTQISAEELNKLLGNAQVFGTKSGQSWKDAVKQLEQLSIDVDALQPLLKGNIEPFLRMQRTPSQQ